MADPTSWSRVPPAGPPEFTGDDDGHDAATPASDENEAAFGLPRLVVPLAGLAVVALVAVWLALVPARPAVRATVPASPSSQAPSTTMPVLPAGLHLAVLNGTLDDGRRVSALAVPGGEGLVVTAALFSDLAREVTSDGDAATPLSVDAVTATASFRLAADDEPATLAPLPVVGAAVSCAYADAGRVAVVAGEVTSRSLLVLGDATLLVAAFSRPCPVGSVLVDASGAVAGLSVAGSDEPAFVAAEPAVRRAQVGGVVPAARLPFTLNGSVVVARDGDVPVQLGDDLVTVDRVALGAAEIVPFTSGLLPGDSVELRVRRAGAEITVSVTLI